MLGVIWATPDGLPPAPCKCAASWANVGCRCSWRQPDEDEERRRDIGDEWEEDEQRERELVEFHDRPRPIHSWWCMRPGCEERAEWTDEDTGLRYCSEHAR